MTSLAGKDLASRKEAERGAKKAQQKAVEDASWAELQQIDLTH